MSQVKGQLLHIFWKLYSILALEKLCQLISRQTAGLNEAIFSPLTPQLLQSPTHFLDLFIENQDLPRLTDKEVLLLKERIKHSVYLWLRNASKIETNI